MSELNVKAIVEKVMDAVCTELDMDREEVSLESDLADLGADSLNLTDIVLEIEDAFGFEMPEDDMHKMKTVGDLVRFSETHAAGE